MADFLADDLVLIGAQALHLGVGHFDRLHRHLGFVEERRNSAVVGEVAAGLAPLVCGHVLLGRRRGLLRLFHEFAQVQLLRIGLGRVALALAAKQLALEPFDLRAQRLDLRGLCAQLLLHCGRHAGQFGGFERACEGGAVHDGAYHAHARSCAPPECPELQSLRSCAAASWR